MKKLFAFVLAFVFCLSLVGCGGAPEPEVPAPEVPTPEEPVQEEPVRGSIVHDWIMRPNGKVRLSLYADGTFHYENDNNNVVEDGVYTYDPKTNVLLIPSLDGESHEGFINDIDEVEIYNENGFMIFSRDLDPNYTEPVPEQAVELWGSWTTADGKGIITFDNGNYEYKESTLILKGSYVTYEADGTVFVDFSPTGMDFELGTAFFYETDKTLMTLMGNIVFAPDDPSYYPGEGTPPAEEIPSEPEEEPEPEQPAEDPEEPEEEPEPEYTGPRGFMNGSWTSGGKKFTFMGDTYKYDDGTTVSTGKYEVFMIDNGRGLRFIPDAGSQQIPDATITSASLSLFVGGEAFNPKDMNDHPFVGVGG